MTTLFEDCDICKIAVDHYELTLCSRSEQRIL